MDLLRGFSFLILYFIITLTELSFAQQEEKNFLGLSFGGSDFHIRDDHASPLFFRSIGISPSFQYFFNGKTERHLVELSYFYDYLGSINTNFNTDNWRGKVRYAYVRSISEFKIMDKQTRVFIGASVSSFLSYSEYRFGGENLAITSWYWNHSLNAEFYLDYNLQPKQFIAVQLSVPLVSNISRPKYSPSENYNYITNNYTVDVFGQTEIFPNNFFINAILTFHTPIINNLDIQIDYDFFYSSYTEPKEVDMYMNNIRAGLFLCF